MAYTNIVQMQFARSGPARQTIASDTPQIVTGLSIDFTPKYADSLILLEAYLCMEWVYVNVTGFYKDGSAIASTSGYTNNCEPNMQYTNYFNTSAAPGRIYPTHIMDSEISGSTTQRTYDVRHSSAWSGSTYTTYINNRSSNDMASFSHFIVAEYYNGE